MLPHGSYPRRRMSTTHTSRIWRLSFVAATVVFLHSIFGSSNPGLAQEPLHQQIDRLMAELQLAPELAVCNDSAFLRRIYLDLTGTIPGPSETRSFLDDQSPDKRAKLIDRLLASPAYARHMASVFDVMLMERRADKYVKADQWDTYLLTSFQANKPYNELAREILAADGANEDARGPAKFYLEREVEPNLLTREVSRMFFGMDLQCAQCHDHPLIGDYAQSDYYGVFAFLNRSHLFQPDKKKPAMIGEKAEGDAKFKSVFTGDEGDSLPRLPGQVEITEPSFPKDEAYQVKPDKNVRPVPKFSRREELAKLAASGTNQAFNRNIANRLWAHMMGRGLVHPVDLHHSDNPPVHPQLLDLLADQFVAMKFDIKAFLRELALSHTYGRTLRVPEDFAAKTETARQSLAALTDELEQVKAAVTELEKSLLAAEKQKTGAEKALAGLPEERKQSTAALAAAKSSAEAAQKTLAQTKTDLADRQTKLGLLQEAAAKTQLAVDKLNDDQELVAVLTVLKSRQEKFSGEVAAMTKAMQDHSAAAAEMTKKLTDAEAADRAVATKEDQLNQQRSAAEQAVVDFQQKLLFERGVVTHLKNQMDRADQVIACGESWQGLVAQRDLQAKLQGDLAKADAAAKQASAELASAKTQLPAAETKLAESQAALKRSTAELAGKRQEAALVGDSLAKADEAAKKLPEDGELRAAVDQLKPRAEAVTAEVATHEGQVAEMQAAQQAADSELKKLQQSVAALTKTVETQQKQAAALKEQLGAATTALVAAEEKFDAAFSQATKILAEQFSAAVLQPLSPEQLAWSMLQATGQWDRQRAAEAAELDKKSPLKPEEQSDPQKIAAREKAIDDQTVAKLKPTVAQFVKLFGAAAGQPQDAFFATVDQALFFANGGSLGGWVAPSGDNLTARLLKIEDAKQLADELYISVLNRRPTDVEVADVSAYLASRPDAKSAVVQELAWALLTSNEFRFHP